MDKSTALAVGNEVVVKSGVIDPDFGMDIGNWAGTILEIDEIESLVLIEWNSKTLESMDEAHIKACEADDLDWTQIYLEFAEIDVLGEVKAESVEEASLVTEAAQDAEADEAKVQ